ncbi:hypothetical protein ACUY4R_002457 [Kosakonia sp. BK9b]
MNSDNVTCSKEALAARGHGKTILPRLLLCPFTAPNLHLHAECFRIRSNELADFAVTENTQGLFMHAAPQLSLPLARTHGLHRSNELPAGRHDQQPG